MTDPDRNRFTDAATVSAYRLGSLAARLTRQHSGNDALQTGQQA